LAAEEEEIAEELEEEAKTLGGFSETPEEGES
jgi:hypothetical protein